MTPIVRFAPSPTGYIHVGNARTALYNWLFAKARSGTFILRFDDTDLERSRAEYAEAIERDIRWLGIAPDRIERQSERLERYAKAAARLKESGLLYPCYETSDELDRQRARQRAMGRPPVYDRRALKLSREDRASLEAQGRRPHWRFLLPNHGGDPLAPQRTEVGWSDLVRGEQHVDLASLSDPVLVREDGTVLYTFASVVDDIDMAVTHIIRGDDHVTNTGVQIPLFRALGGEPPVFGHHNLLQSEAGEGLSKRMASLSLASLREEGIEALAVASLAVLVGTSEAVRPVASLDELAGIANLDKINRAPARFSMDELRGLSAKVLAHLPYSAVAERLREATIDGGEAFWNAVRGNIASLREAAQWWAVVQGPSRRLLRRGIAPSWRKRRDICRRSLGASEPGLSGPPR
jgi:glutamyl-tRNA synthetase